MNLPRQVFKMIVDGDGVTVHMTDTQQPVEILFGRYEANLDKLCYALGWSDGKTVEIDEPKLLAACRSAHRQAKEGMTEGVAKAERIARFEERA